MTEGAELLDEGVIGFHSPIPEGGAKAVVATLDEGGGDVIPAIAAGTFDVVGLLSLTILDVKPFWEEGREGD